MANKRIKDLTERTTLAAGDYLATDNDNGTRKVNASKILTPISTAQSTADNVATKVSNSGDAFSSSKGYSVGELCIYNNMVYRCKTAYSTGASWSKRSAYFEQVTLTDAVSDLSNDFNSRVDVSSNITKSSYVSSIDNLTAVKLMGKIAIVSANIAISTAATSTNSLLYGLPKPKGKPIVNFIGDNKTHRGYIDTDNQGIVVLHTYATNNTGWFSFNVTYEIG